MADILLPADLGYELQVSLAALQGLSEDSRSQANPHHLFKRPFDLAFVELPGALTGHFLDFLFLVVDLVGPTQHFICLYLISFSQKPRAS